MPGRTYIKRPSRRTSGESGTSRTSQPSVGNKAGAVEIKEGPEIGFNRDSLKRKSYRYSLRNKLTDLEVQRKRRQTMLNLKNAKLSKLEKRDDSSSPRRSSQKSIIDSPASSQLKKYQYSDDFWKYRVSKIMRTQAWMKSWQDKKLAEIATANAFPDELSPIQQRRRSPAKQECQDRHHKRHSNKSKVL